MLYDGEAREYGKRGRTREESGGRAVLGGATTTQRARVKSLLDKAKVKIRVARVVEAGGRDSIYLCT